MSKLTNFTRSVKNKTILVGGTALLCTMAVGGSVKLSQVAKEQNTNIPEATVEDGYFDENFASTEGQAQNQELFGSTRDGIKVEYLENENEKTYSPEAVEEYGYSSSENNGDASSLEGLQQSITDSVLNEVEKHYGTVIEGAKGEKGDPGVPGSAGLTGKTGQPGKQGIKGSTGSAGLTGKTGEVGKSGEDGEDGLSVFIVYSEYTNGMNGSTPSMQNSPTASTKFMGVANAKTKPTSASSYTWTQYKDLSIHATTENGVPKLVIQ